MLLAVYCNFEVRAEGRNEKIDAEKSNARNLGARRRYWSFWGKGELLCSSHDRIHVDRYGTKTRRPMSQCIILYIL